jgi:hypothetical protein
MIAFPQIAFRLTVFPPTAFRLTVFRRTAFPRDDDSGRCRSIVNSCGARYGGHPGVAMVQKSIAEPPEKKGRSPEQWIELVRKEGPPAELASALGPRQVGQSPRGARADASITRPDKGQPTGRHIRKSSRPRHRLPTTIKEAAAVPVLQAPAAVSFHFTADPPCEMKREMKVK